MIHAHPSSLRTLVRPRDRLERPGGDTGWGSSPRGSASYPKASIKWLLGLSNNVCDQRLTMCARERPRAGRRFGLQWLQIVLLHCIDGIALACHITYGIHGRRTGKGGGCPAVQVRVASWLVSNDANRFQAGPTMSREQDLTSHAGAAAAAGDGRPAALGLPEKQGLYDPAVRARRLRRRLRGRHQGPQVPPHPASRRSRCCRTSITAAPAAAKSNTGDGAGMLLQMPHAFNEEVCTQGAHRAARGRASTAAASSSCRAIRPVRRKLEQKLRADRAVRGPDGARLAHRADQQRDARRDGTLLRAVHAPGVHRPQRRHRATTWRSSASSTSSASAPTARSARRRSTGAEYWYIASLSSQDAGLQGHAADDAARPVFPRPAQPADGDRARAGALALQHEHVPELGPRASVPLHRPQRRDQHAARQHQLDARARGAASSPSCSATTSRRSCRSSTRTAATRRCSTTRSSCSCSPAARCRTR